MKNRFAPILAFLVMSGVTQAANVFSITGSSTFGFANQKVLVQAWSQVSIYSNVTITMPLADLSSGGPIGGVEGTVYLMNQIGPGTTSANEVAPPVSISGLTASFTTRTLFSGLTLGAGNYYVVLVPTNTSPLSMSPEAGDSEVVTPGVGVAALGATSSLTPAPYPPATVLPLNPPGNLFINVDGDLRFSGASSVPALGTVGLGALLLGLAGAGIYFLRHQGA
jgi:hypothetical protein